jgi:hypothetical protein
MEEELYSDNKNNKRYIDPSLRTSISIILAPIDIITPVIIIISLILGTPRPSTPASSNTS